MRIIGTSADHLAGLQAWRRLLIGFSALLAFLGTTTFLLRAMRAPRRAALVLISDQYFAPWDLNPWVEENASLFRQMHQRNLDVIEVQGQSLLKEEGEIVLQNAALRGSRPLLVYVNLHGAVDHEGNPCLLLPESQGDDPHSWLTVQQLIRTVIERMPTEHSLTVIFESSRQAAAPPHALASQSFGDALRALLERESGSWGVPALNVLVSEAGFQSTPTDWQYGVDVFSRFVAEGLSGAADDGDSGNGDGAVQFGELERFVQQETNRWSLLHRAREQKVWSWSSSKDRELVWALADDLQLPSPIPFDSQATERLTQAWARLATFHQSRAWDVEPRLWVQANDNALAAEQAAHGGLQARKLFPSMASALEHDLQELAQRLGTHQEAAKLDQKLYASQELIWRQFAEEPNADFVREVLADRPSLSDQAAAAMPFFEVLGQQSSDALWEETDFLQAYAKARAELCCMARESAVNGDFLWRRKAWSDLLSQGRRMDDLLVGDVRSVLPQLHSEYETFREQLIRVHQQQQHLVRSIRLRNDLLNNLHDWASCLLPLAERTAASTGALCDQVDQLGVGASILSGAEPGEFVSADFYQLADAIDGFRARKDALWQEIARPASAERMRAASVLTRHTWYPAQTEFLTVAGAKRLQAYSKMRKDERHLAEHEVDLEATDKASQLQFEELDALARKSYLRLNHELEQVGTSQESGAPKDGADSSGEWSLTDDEVVDCWEYAIQERIQLPLWGQGRDLSGSMNLQALADSERLKVFAEQQLEDFWNLPAIEDQAFFAWAANEALLQSEELRQVLQEDRGLRNRETPQRTDGHTLRGQIADAIAATRGLNLNAQWNARRGEADDEFVWSADVTLQSQSLLSSIPAGVARLNAEQGETRVDRFCDRRELASQGALQVGEWNFDKVSAPLKPTRVSLQFRGHTLASTQLASPFSPQSTRVALPSSQDAEIQVVGSQTTPASRVFVLDCSASMFEGATIEQPGIQPNGRRSWNKLEAAKLALLNLLEQLVESEEQIGVVLYGHRLAQGTAEQGVLEQTKYTTSYSAPDSLKPYSDVEVVLPTGRFGRAEFNAVQSRLQAVLPWGQSPMLLAIMRAVEQVKASQAAGMADVIVISDGQDYQFMPSEDASFSVDDVVAAASDADVQLHMIGFGVRKGEALQSELQFRALAEGTGGTHTQEVANASLLLSNLRERTRTARLEVRRLDGTPIDAELNQRVRIPRVSQLTERIALDFNNRTYFVSVEPGDQLRLIAEPDGNLHVPRYLERQPRFGNFVGDGGLASGLRLGIHQPVMEDRGVRWMVSIQSAAAELIERPVQLALELKPIAGDSEVRLPSYWFCENCGRMRDGALVFEFNCEHWPEQAREAEVRAWLLPGPINDLEFVPIPVGSHSHLTESNTKIDSSRSEGALRLFVHSDAQGILVSKGKPPEVAGRRVSEDSRLAIHTWQIQDEAPVEVAWVTGEYLQRKALKIATPMRVGLSDGDNRVAVEPSIVVH